MGQYDFPAMIDYILSQTNSSSLNYIGHSQGTTSLLVCLSVRPEYNKKVSQAHIFAPSAYRKKVPKSLLVYSFLRFLVSESKIASNESKIMLMNSLCVFSSRVPLNISHDSRTDTVNSGFWSYGDFCESARESAKRFAVTMTS